MMAGVSFTLFFSQKTGQSSQLSAQIFAMPFKSVATALYASRKSLSAALDCLKNHTALTALSLNLPITPSKFEEVICWMSCFMASIVKLLAVLRQAAHSTRSGEMADVMVRDIAAPC